MDLAQLFFNGITLGSIIALAAVGLTLTYGILKLSNFAHGDLMTLGAYITWVANTQGVNVWIGMILGALGTVVAMLVSEFLLWKPMRNRRATSTTLIIISIGLALFIRSSILLIWGGSNKNYDLPLREAQEFVGLKLPYYNLVVLGLTVVVIIGLRFLLQNTKIGKAMRAVADNLDLARVSGINVERIVLATWVINGTLTALGGGMYGLITAVRPNMGWFLILPMFAAVILGGIGNPYGAIAGALVIGVVQELTVGVAQTMDISWLSWLGPDYKLGVALLIMVVMLLIRPQGLFKGMM